MCGKPMELLGDDGQRWYCYNDDEVFFAEEQRWLEKVEAAPTYAPQTTQSCNCGRSTPHVHYPPRHDLMVKIGAGGILLLELLAFIAGFVKGSTLLYNLSYEEITSYTFMADQIIEASAPYEPIENLLIFVDLLVIIFAITALLTLRSPKVTLHWASLLGIGILVPLEFGLLYYEDVVANQIVAHVASQVDERTLRLFANVQQKFHDAYGFWDSAAYTGLRLLLLIVSIVSIYGGLVLSKVVIKWPSAEQAGPQPSIIQVPRTSPSSPERVGEKSLQTAQTKYCRYCGVKILRESKFCGQCGTKLI